MRDRPAADRPEPHWPTVSVVVVNFNGRDYLDRCLGSLRDLDYPEDAVEVVFIDNASTDGSVEHVRESFPEVRVVVNDENTGFSPAVNQGAQEASGRYLALLNNDAEADPGWLRHAVRVLESEPVIACVGSKILREDRETIDYAGGQLAFYGHGFAKGVEEHETTEQGRRPTLFASGGAMITRRSTFLDVGGFDESYFAFFEDVDYGWRLWVLGHEVVYVPRSRVYHRHHGTIERFGYARERYLLERNALATIFKNYADDRLARILPASMLLTVFRGLDLEGLELPDYRITDDATPLDDLTIPATTGAHLAALRDFALSLDDLRVKRELIQSKRTTTDRELLKLFEEALRPNVFRDDFLEAFDQVVRAFNLRDHARPRSRVLVITQDRIAERMAAPAIRCWEIVSLLAHNHEVTLASTQEPARSHESFTTTQIHAGNVDQLLADADVVIFQGFVMHEFPQIAASDCIVVVDAYDPFHLEGLNLGKDDLPAERYATAKSQRGILEDQLKRADFLVAASEKQRDYWLGQLAGVGRINPATYDADESLRRLIDSAPFGLPSDPPKKEHEVVKDVVPGIEADDFLLLWGGGIYDWLDPLSLIRAVGKVAPDHPDVKLYFMSAGEPDDASSTTRMAVEAIALAEDLGLRDTHVFFHDGWVAYDRRADYYLEADVGISVHLEHVEAAFSFRARVLDYLWAGAPVIASEGDSTARLVAEHDAGITVPTEDVEALAAAIVRLRTDQEHYTAAKANVEALAAQLWWVKTLEPLVEFCDRPRRAPDRVGRASEYVAGRGVVVTRPARYYLRRFREYAQTTGPRTALIHARNFVRQRLGG